VGIVALNSAVWREPGREPEDLLDVLEEAEVEHLVGLVEHDEAGGVEDQRVAGDQVEHAAHGPDDDVAAGPQLRLLRADRGAAEHGHDVHALVRPVGADRLGDLDAELAGRGQHEPLDHAVLGVHVLEHGQAERRRLSAARLGLADHVAALEERRYGLDLDRARDSYPTSRRAASMGSDSPRSAKDGMRDGAYGLGGPRPPVRLRLAPDAGAGHVERRLLRRRDLRRRRLKPLPGREHDHRRRSLT
jgi:hypothetical protein